MTRRIFSLQMKNIFIEVTRNATVLDQTFAEQFGQAVNDTAGDGRQVDRDSESLLPHRKETRRQSSNFDSTASRSEEVGAINDSTSAEKRQRRQRTPSRSSDSSLAVGRPHHAPSMTTDVPRCEVHGLPCHEREVTRNGPNTGRMFYVCPLPQGEQCNFFAWASDSNPSDVLIVKCPGHDEPCDERTVKKDGPNKGRQFFTCRRSQTDNSCGFFQWKVDIAEAPDRPVAPGRSVAQPAPRVAGISGATPICSGHKTTCDLRITRKAGSNQNREFYCCSFQGEASCGFFEWKDEQRQQPATLSMPSSSEGRGGDSEMFKCECSLPGVLLTCKSGVNKGRTFYKCPNPQGSQCDFFQWGS